MADNSKYSEEVKYLEDITALLESMLEYEKRQLENQKADLIESRREMWKTQPTHLPILKSLLI